MNGKRHYAILLELSQNFTEQGRIFNETSLVLLNKILNNELKDLSLFIKKVGEINKKCNIELDIYKLEKKKLKNDEVNEIYEAKVMKACKELLHVTDKIKDIDPHDYNKFINILLKTTLKR